MSSATRRSRLFAAVDSAARHLTRNLNLARRLRACPPARPSSGPCEHMERRVLFAATAPFGSGTHYFDQAPFSTSDLSSEAAQANPNAAGTQDAAASAAGVRYFDGTPQLSATDLSSDGFGQTWGVTRSYSPDMTGAGPLGNHWFLNQLPQLVQEGSADPNQPSGATGSIILVSGASDQRWFDQLSGAWTERYGGKDALAATTYSGHSAYVLTTSTGQRLYFYDFASGNGPQKGQFLAATDPYGNLTHVTSTDTSGDITEVQRADGSTIESWQYTFNTPGGVITNIKLRRSTNSGTSWSTARQSAYAYDASSNLTSATIEDGSGTAIGTWCYVYWAGTETVSEGGVNVTQPANAIKYAFSPEAYARMYANLPSGTTPATATDAQLSPYADHYFAYNAAGQVYSETSAGAGGTSTGGLGTFTFAYANNTNAGYTKGFGSWAEKTTETLPDGNTNEVYSSYAGERVLGVFTSGSTNWGTFDEFDSNGRLTLEAEPSALSLPASLSTLESNNDLLHSQSGNFQYLSDDAGLVKVIDYYTSGTPGYYEDTSVKQGELGTAVPQQTRTYTSHSDGTTTIYPVACDTVYRNTNGTGGETTSYSYSFFTGTNQPQTITETLPTIGSGQNGPGTSDQPVYTYNKYNMVTDVVDGDSKETTTSWYTDTGAVHQTVADPGTGHLALTTTYVVDLLGRPTQITDPNSNVTYFVRSDTAHEQRTFRGWHEIGTSGNYTTTGPVQVSRTYYPVPNAASGQRTLYDEVLSFNPPVETTSTPSGSESISESNIQGLSRDLTNAGQVSESDAYFSLGGVTYSQSSPQLGSSSNNSASGNYHATLLAYDNRGRESHVQDPTNTITDVTFDGLDRPTQVKSGTNDTTSNNMVAIQDLTYDQLRAAPSAPTLSQSGTGSTGGSTLYVKVTYLGPGGESLASSESSLLVFAGNQLVVTAPSSSTGVTSYNVYVGASSGGETQQNTSPITLGTNWTQPTSGTLVSGSLPPVDQVGDSDLTKSVQHTTSSSSGDRQTLYLFDWRDREIAEKDGAQASEGSINRPVYLYTLDNLGEATASYTYAGDTTTLSYFANGQPSTYSGRLRAQVLSSFDDQQRPYLAQQYSVNQGSGAVSSTNILSTDWYYNYRNNVIAVLPPGGEAQKHSFDAADRDTADSVTDNGVLNGATQDWTTASSTAHDVVVQQTLNTHDNNNNLTETLDRQRFDNDPSTSTGEGALTGPPGASGSSLASRDYYTDYYYDPANRPTGMVHVGTNGGTTWYRTVLEGTPADDYLATTQGYAADAVQTVTLTGSPTGGTFTLTFNTHTTGALAYNASASTVQTAIAALTGVGTGNVSVAGAAGGPYSVRFIGTLAGAAQPTMTADGSGLTGGTTPSASSATTAVGGDGGNAADFTDPRGLTTFTDADLLGRPISTINDFTDGVPTASSNQTVTNTYDGDNNTLTMTAVQSSGVNQTTGYVYAAGGTAGTNLFSNDLLTTIQYPDKTTGLPSTSSSNQDVYTYNWAAEPLSYVDRNATTHNYTWDSLGRETMDSVSAFGTGVDSTVKSLTFAYAPLNLPGSQASYSAANGGGTQLNSEADSYNGFGQISSQSQSFASGAGWASGSTGTVQYVYNEANSGTENNSRLRALVYPSAGNRVVETDYSSRQSPISSITHSGATATATTTGSHNLSIGDTVVIEGATPAAYDGAFTVVSTTSTTFTYTMATTPASNASGSYMTAAAQGLDQAVSRPDGLQDKSTGTVLEGYTYLGSNTIVQASHPQTGINETRISQGAGDTSAPPSYAATGGDRYTGLDQFGRIDDVYYVNPSTLTSPTDRFQYAYDRGSNPLYKNVVEQGTAGAAYSQLYHASGGANATGYDNLNRLTSFSQGALTAAGVNNPAGVLDTVSTANESQTWSLDALGNWSTLTASPGPTLARTFNAQNEITNNSGSTTPTYDNDGNVTRDDHGDTLTFDAWNRLVNNGVGTTYQFLPLGERASATLCSGVVTQFSYYSTDWQGLEDDLPPAGSGGAAQATTYVWGLEYVNELVARDDSSGARLYAQHDANFDITALVDTTGAVKERFSYDPYGKGTVLNATTWASRGDGYDWQYRWQGGRFDPVGGLYSFQNRDYSPSLGTWLQNDPAGYVNGPNTYQAMLGAPIGHVDPEGLQAVGPSGSGGGAGSGSTTKPTNPSPRGPGYIPLPPKPSTAPSATAGPAGAPPGQPTVHNPSVQEGQDLIDRLEYWLSWYYSRNIDDQALISDLEVDRQRLILLGSPPDAIKDAQEGYLTGRVGATTEAIDDLQEEIAKLKEVLYGPQPLGPPAPPPYINRNKPPRTRPPSPNLGPPSPSAPTTAPSGSGTPAPRGSGSSRP